MFDAENYAVYEISRKLACIFFRSCFKLECGIKRGFRAQ